MNEVDDIITALGNAGIATLNTNMFPGIVRDGAGYPDWCVFVSLTGGLEPEPFFNNDGDRRQPFVQIRLRTGVNTADGGHDTAKSIFNAIHRQEPAGYESWLCSEPINIGLDNKGRLGWSINVKVAYCT